MAFFSMIYVVWKIIYIGNIVHATSFHSFTNWFEGYVPFDYILCFPGSIHFFITTTEEHKCLVALIHHKQDTSQTYMQRSRQSMHQHKYTDQYYTDIRHCLLNLLLHYKWDTISCVICWYMYFIMRFTYYYIHIQIYY